MNDRVDRLIRVLMVLTLLMVAAFAFIESYSHLYYLAQAHHETGAALRLLPLSVDCIMVMAGLVMLHLGRNGLKHPLPRSAMILGASVTLAGNIGYGIFYGWLAALISAWAPVAIALAVELGMLLVRSMGQAKPELRDASKTINELRAGAGYEPYQPEHEGVPDSPGSLQGWGQLSPPAGGLDGIGLAPKGR